MALLEIANASGPCQAYWVGYIIKLDHCMQNANLISAIID